MDIQDSCSVPAQCDISDSYVVEKTKDLADKNCFINIVTIQVQCPVLKDLDLK